LLKRFSNSETRRLWLSPVPASQQRADQEMPEESGFFRAREVARPFWPG
jgi:hypothetical protein